MTKSERTLAISYADIIQVEDLLQHILRIDGDYLLSQDGRRKFAQAQILLEQVHTEYSKLMAQATDFSGKELHEHNKGSCDQGQGCGAAI